MSISESSHGEGMEAVCCGWASSSPQSWFSSSPTVAAESIRQRTSCDQTSSSEAISWATRPSTMLSVLFSFIFSFFLPFPFFLPSCVWVNISRLWRLEAYQEMFSMCAAINDIHCSATPHYGEKLILSELGWANVFVKGQVVNISGLWTR